MNKPLDVFYKIPCLTERSPLLNGLALQKKWFKSADKRYLGQYLQKFINYNLDLFNFLGVEPNIMGTDQNISLCFRSTEFIGAIPLRSSDTGKQIGDFVVTPRFTGRSRYEDYIQILNLLGSEISPQVIDSLPLASGRNFRPPLYLEAIKFISSLEKLLRTFWRKFDTLEKSLSHPSGQVNWNKYILNQGKVENALRFPTRKNILNQFHKEYSEIRYVFDLCKKEFFSANTPLNIKRAVKSRLNFIEEKLHFHPPSFTENIHIRQSDNPIVKTCKHRANSILKSNLVDSTAWRVDFSDVFEKFVQHIFKELSKETGGRLLINYKFKSKSSKRYSWELKYLEPDCIYQKDDITIFIDAKYKSNLFNKFSESETLKEDHRRDLHQILAYSAFDKAGKKHAFLCYPSNEIEIKTVRYLNLVNDNFVNISLAGIPLKKSEIVKTKMLVQREIELMQK